MNKRNGISRGGVSKLAGGVAVFSGTFLLALLAGSAFLPVEKSLAANTSVDIEVTLSPVIALTTNVTTLSIPIVPDSDGSLGTGNLIVNVSTNNQTGYELSMYSMTNDTSLVHINTNDTIPSTTAPIGTPAPLPVNQWGYWRWEDSRVTTPTTFARIPRSYSPDTLRETISPAATSETTLTFAANINILQPQGHYQNTMVFTATGNYVPEPPRCPVLTGKTYLQDIKRPTGPVYGRPNQRVVLKDRRDNQDYYVQNIVDQHGDCTAWMETNLRYGGDGNWDASWGYADDRYANSDLTDGMTPADTNNTDDDTNPLTMVSGSMASSYTVAQMADPGGSPTLDTTNPTNNTTFYGYLYNWCAAMGGGAGVCNSTLDFSLPHYRYTICPNGWDMPSNYPSFGDFYELSQVLNGSGTGQGLRDTWLGVYSGDYDSGLGYQGTEGIYWSSSEHLGPYDTAAYALTLTNTYATVNSFGSRSYSYAVRCVL